MVEHVSGTRPQPRQSLGVHAGDSVWSVPQAVTIGIFADRDQELADRCSGAVVIERRSSTFRPAALSGRPLAPVHLTPGLCAFGRGPVQPGHSLPSCLLATASPDLGRTPGAHSTRARSDGADAYAGGSKISATSDLSSVSRSSSSTTKVSRTSRFSRRISYASWCAVSIIDRTSASMTSAICSL